MGIELVRVVVASAEWAKLVGPVARNLMAAMCVRAKETGTGKPPAYWGGRDDLVIATYGQLQEDPDKRADQYRYISRLLRELKNVGAIVPTNVAVRGKVRQAYEIRVMPWSHVDESSTDEPPEPDPPSGRNVHTQVDDLSTENPSVWTNRPQSVDDLTILRSTEDVSKSEDLGGGDIEQLSAQPHLGARASELNKPERCAECGRPERDCRARSAIHGQHEYRPTEYAPLRLA